MSGPRAWSAPLGLAAVSLAGCFTASHTMPPAPVAVPVPASPPAGTLPPALPDIVPRVEPLSRYGNPPFYEVYGKRYYVLSSSVGYIERGVASWYGPGFHEVRTSTGETYDMYAMTAAHKTLPLPAYVRVTNLENGRSVVVRVNDRGPFVGNRIIDLSYTAASRLGMLRNGTAMVEVRALDPRALVPDPGAPVVAASPQSGQVGAPAPQAAVTGAATTATTLAAVTPTAPQTQTPTQTPTTTATTAMSTTGTVSVLGATGASPASLPTSAIHPALFVQAGAFADPANAERLVAKLRGGGYGTIFVREDIIAGRKMYRVRIGPVPNVPEFDRIVAALESVGVHDAHLALD